MKILIRKSDSVVFYAQDDLILDTELHGSGWRDPAFNTDNAKIEDATLPENWFGGAWSYDGTWAIANQTLYDTMMQAKAAKAAAELRAKREVLVVTPWQIRKALNATGLRDDVEAGVAVSGQSTKDAWEFAQEFKRLDPLVIGLGTMLGKTDAELDTLFELAVSL